MGRPVVLAVDIGTSSTRAAFYRETGESFGLVQAKYGVLRPAPFMEEQDPDFIRAKVLEVIGACLTGPEAAGNEVRGLTFTSQMYSVFPVDADGRPLANSILWSDGRAEDIAAELRQKGLHVDLYRSTCCPVNSIYPLTKILWLRRHRPEVCAKAERFVSIKDYVLQPLLGDWVMDHSSASGTGMFDVAAGTWAKNALDAVGLDADRLPRLVAGDAPLPIRNEALRKQWGLSPDAKIFSGGGDGPLANLGSGSCDPGTVNIDLGTSGAARVVVDRPALDEKGRLWCYSIIPGRWAFGGIVTNVGNAMQWLGGNVAAFRSDRDPETAATDLSRLATEVPPGSDGVFFLPFLRKARSPYWDDRLRGSLFGLTAGHDIRHIARAVLEAIAFDIAAIVDIAAEKTELVSPLIFTGGLSKNVIMPQLLADAIGRDIETPEQCEGSLTGAAIIGLRGAGLLDGFAFKREKQPARAGFSPDPAVRALYAELRAIHSSLVETISGLHLQPRGK